MGLVIVETTLGSAVLDNGTVALSYPEGFTAGAFTFAVGHKAVLNGNSSLAYNKEFALTFGDNATGITFTNRTGATLAAGTRLQVQLETPGFRSNVLRRGDVLPATQKFTRNTYALKPVLVDLGAPATADPNGILDDASATDSAQNYTSADFESTYDNDNGLDVPRNLTATGTAGSNHVITVTGKDQYGNTMVENLTLNGTAVISGVKAFKKVTNVAVAAGASGDTFDLGWGNVLGLPFVLPAVGLVKDVFVDDVRIPNENNFTHYLYSMIQDVSSAGQAYIKSPVAGRITAIETILGGAITSADAGLTAKIGGTGITGGTITVANSGSGAGVEDSATPTALNVLSVGSLLELETDGASTGAQQLDIRYTVKTATINAAVTTEPTATTGDVYGTYEPDTAPNGDVHYKMFVMAPDPEYTVVSQFAG